MKIDAGILFAHRGNDRNAQFVLDSATESTGSHAVTTGIEARPANEQVDLCGPQFCQYRRRELILMLDGIVIAADKGQSHASVIAERRFKQLARSNCAVANLQTLTCVLFCTNPAEKLIQIMCDTHARS